VVSGTVAPGFEPVRDAFAAALAGRTGNGAAVAAWHDGRWVADLWGGPGWQRDSIAQVYSVTKPFTAVCALLLAARGHLDLDAPVAAYWPGFRAPATVRQVLSHQAGLVALDEPLPAAAWSDWDRVCAALAAQQPAWPPGAGHGESALLYGHLVGEIVRRVDGRSLGRFLREEVCGPLDLDFAVGLTAAEQSRAVDLTGLTEDYRARTRAGRPPLAQRALANPAGAHDPAVVNSPAWRAAEIPAINGHGTARAIAGFYAALRAGRLLPPDLLREATTPHCTGPDRVVGGVTTWGLGFLIEPEGYGMAGLGGSIGWAEPGGDYAFGYVTATMTTHADALAVENALRGCLDLPAITE
jgi:CubicO group peptidase (beta-lactamase class C family)